MIIVAAQNWQTCKRRSIAYAAHPVVLLLLW
jgi:hypothetical protein